MRLKRRVMDKLSAGPDINYTFENLWSTFNSACTVGADAVFQILFQAVQERVTPNITHLNWRGG